MDVVNSSAWYDYKSEQCNSSVNTIYAQVKEINVRKWNDTYIKYSFRSVKDHLGNSDRYNISENNLQFEFKIITISGTF